MAKDPVISNVSLQDPVAPRKRKPKPAAPIEDAAKAAEGPPPVTEAELSSTLYGLSQARAFEWAARLGIKGYDKMNRMRLLRTIAAREGFPDIKFPVPQSAFEATRLTRVSPVTGAPIPFEIEDYLGHRGDTTRYSQRVINAMESRCKELGF